MRKLNITRAERTAWAMSDFMAPVYAVAMTGEIDATPLESLRLKAKSTVGAAPSYTSIVIKTVALLMKRNPAANRGIFGIPFFKTLIQFENTDVSVAVEKDLAFLPGLAYGTKISGTGDKPLLQITSELRSLSRCTEADHAGYAEYMRILRFVPRPLSNFILNLSYRMPSLWVKYHGCAAWVNAPSKPGADAVFATWPWPITFSFGVVKKRPFVVNDELAVRSTMPVSMVFDRRIMGGGPASRLFSEYQMMLGEADKIFENEFPVSQDPP